MWRRSHGAQVTALGSHASALYANDDELAAALVGAGERAHDRFWRMPLWDDYQDALKSEFADMKNIGRPGRWIDNRGVLPISLRQIPVGASRHRRRRLRGRRGQAGHGRPTAALFEYLLASTTRAAAEAGR